MIQQGVASDFILEVVFSSMGFNFVFLTAVCISSWLRNYIVRVMWFVTVQLLASSYFQPSMCKEVCHFVFRCRLCQLAKGTSSNAGLYLPSHIYPRNLGPTLVWTSSLLFPVLSVGSTPFLWIDFLRWFTSFRVRRHQMRIVRLSCFFERFIVCVAFRGRLCMAVIRALWFIFDATYGATQFQQCLPTSNRWPNRGSQPLPWKFVA